MASTDAPKGDAKAGGDPGITMAQLDNLVDLKKTYLIEKKEWDTTLLKLYGVTTARSLTKEQGDHFINYLKTQRVPF